MKKAETQIFNDVNTSKGDKKFLTPKDYNAGVMNTQEVKEYIDARLPSVRAKLGKQYASEIRKVLLANGFDYPIRYIGDAIRDGKRTYNIHVFKAAQRIAERAIDPYVNTMVDPQMDEERNTRMKKRNPKPLSKQLGLTAPQQ